VRLGSLHDPSNRFGDVFHMGGLAKAAGVRSSCRIFAFKKESLKRLRSSAITAAAPQERERTNKHALVANRYQLRHPATIARGQDGDRIAIAGSEQLGVPLARYLFAQAPAVRKTLGERAPGGLAHLACDIKHANVDTGRAAACALERRQRPSVADITRRAAWGLASTSP